MDCNHDSVISTAECAEVGDFLAAQTQKNIVASN